jgi:outer membrane receptor for Fe3+-dicitrate
MELQEQMPIIKAEAIAAHILYNLTVDKFTFTPGIRYEDIKLNSLNYGTNDVSRAGTTLAKAKTNVWIPGLGILIKSVMTTIYLPAFTKGFRLQESKRRRC